MAGTPRPCKPPPRGCASVAYRQAVQLIRAKDIILLVYRCVAGLSTANRIRHTAQPMETTQRAREHSGLSRVGYTDAFRVETARRFSPVELARNVFEQPHPPLPATLHFLWSKIVRLDLTSRADRTRVLGWKVLTPSSDAVVLASDAPGMHVRLIGVVEPAAVSWTTTIEYQKWYGRALFTVLGPVRRTLAGYLLARAAC